VCGPIIIPEMIFFFLLPAGIIVVSYLAICVSAGTAWPWQAVVHESGRLTLAQTVLYYEHAGSELPLDLLTGASAAAGLICFRRARPHLAGVEAGRLRGRLRVAGTVLFAGVMLILAGTVLTRGWDELRLHLLQNYTRLGEPAILGSHWRYHLLAQSGLMRWAFWMASCWSYLHPDAWHTRAAHPRWYFAALLLFVVLSVAFGLTAEPFTNGRYLGHQARELFTHALVTLPLSTGAGLAVLPGPAGRLVKAPWRGFPVAGWIAGAAAALAGTYLAVATLVTKAAAQAQTASPVSLIFVHFFEHSFSYLISASLSAVIILSDSLRGAKAPAHE